MSLTNFLLRLLLLTHFGETPKAEILFWMSLSKKLWFLKQANFEYPKTVILDHFFGTHVPQVVLTADILWCHNATVQGDKDKSFWSIIPIMPTN